MSRRNRTKSTRTRLSVNLAEDRNAPGSLFSPLDPLADAFLLPGAVETPDATPAVATSSVITVSGPEDAAPSAPDVLQGPPGGNSAARDVVSVAEPVRKTDPLAADILWDPGVTPTAVYVDDPAVASQSAAAPDGGNTGTPTSRSVVTHASAAPAGWAADEFDSGTGTGSSYTSGSGSGSGSMRSIHMTFDSKYIPVNANNDNGSPWKSAALPFIPTTRDFAATNLPVDDPQLVKVTLNISPGPAGTLSVSAFTPGEASVAFWEDKRKQSPFSSKLVDGKGGPSTVTFYVEGTHESSSLLDEVRIDLTFTTPQLTMELDQTVWVTPFINTTQSFTSTVPDPSVYFTNRLPVDGYLGMTAGQPPQQPGEDAVDGIEFDAKITNGTLTMKYVQILRDVQNGANGSGAGGVYTVASGLANQNLLPKPGSGLTYPALDSIDPADPTASLDFTSTPTATGVRIYTADAPGSSSPTNADKLDKLDVKYLFRTHIVARYLDNSLYPIAYWDWNVNFYATTNVLDRGVTVIAAASKVSLEGSWVKSNADPLKTAGPIPNRNTKWQ